MNDLAAFLQQAEQTMKEYEPSMSISVDRDGGAVELVLDPTVATYSEWIPGEGGDICLLRCLDTRKVMGVRLPLMNERLSVFHDASLIRINDGFKRQSC